jgi:radical SAM protein with 4Fe4S-binding SPASM domain
MAIPGTIALPLPPSEGAATEATVLRAPLENPLSLESPLKLTVCLTETCNLDCRPCYADCHASKARRELDGQAWHRLLDDAVDDGVVALYFEGGEPLLHPGFLDIARHVSDRAYIMLRTHATTVDKAMAETLKEVGVALVFVDLWAADPAIHDALTGTPGSHARTVAGIAALRAAGLDVQTLIILNRRNVGDLNAQLRLSRDLGASATGILRLYPLGRARREWPDLSLSLAEQMRALAAVQAPDLPDGRRLRIMQSWHPNDHNCCWHMAAVNAFGDSIGCAYLREYVNYGSLLDKSLRETWDHPTCRELRRGAVEKACSSCSTSQNSHGGCRSTAYAFHGRFDAPDPFDVTLNDDVDLCRLPA